MLKRISVCGVITLMGLATTALANVSYYAVSDFPTSPTLSNVQNGVWSYGYATTLTPGVNFALDTVATDDYFNDGKAVVGFYAPAAENQSLPTVLDNNTGGTINEGSISNWPDTLLLMHPGCAGILSGVNCESGGEYSVVRFTAPAAATYVVTGMFVPLDSGATYDSASVTASGPTSTTIFSTPSTGTTYNFGFDRTLAAGQSLYFAVGPGIDGRFNNDSTGFSATITATPEPGLYGLLALGLLSLALLVRRHRQA